MRKPKVLPLDEATAKLGEAEALLERWTAGVADHAREAEVLAAELAELQARAADDLLDDDEDDDGAVLARVAEALSRKQVEQGLAVQAVQRAAERLSGVRREVLRARAAMVRSRAEGLRQVAASRQARTDQLLAELTEFEGVAFGPAARADTLGVVVAGFTPRTLTQRVLARAQWLTDHAAGHEHFAEHGADDQVASAVAAGMPQLDEAERAVAPAEAGV